MDTTQATGRTTQRASMYLVGWTQGGRDIKLEVCAAVAEWLVNSLLDSGIGAVSVQFRGTVRV